MKLEPRINPKFLTLAEKTVSYVLTMTDDGKQWQEDREGVEKRIVSVLSSFSLSWLLHILCHLYMIAGRGFARHLVELIFEVGCCLQKADG